MSLDILGVQIANGSKNPDDGHGDSPKKNGNPRAEVGTS
jgi:hypothetical protein